MAIRGGGDRRELRPLQTDAGVLGNHKGAYEALNIKNAQPDEHYKYVRLSDSAIQTALNLGYRFVMDDDPEDWGVSKAEMPMRVQGALDSRKAFQDVVLMKIKLDKYVELRNEHDARSRAALDGAEAAYLNAGEDNAAAIGAAAGENPLHYSRKTHRTGFNEHKE